MSGILTGKSTQIKIRKKTIIMYDAIRLMCHRFNSNDALCMMESPSSSAGSLDQASPRFRSHGDNSANFYVTMTSTKSKVSVSNQ